MANSDQEMRDKVLLRMLKTPPKPHEEMKVRKPRAKPTKSPAERAAKQDRKPAR